MKVKKSQLIKIIREQLSGQEIESMLQGNTKKSYRQLLKIHHPDKSSDPRSEEAIKDLNSLYSYLDKLNTGERLTYSEINDLIRMIGSDRAAGLGVSLPRPKDPVRQQQQQRSRSQVTMEDLIAMARNVAKTQNIKAFLRAYISLCGMARNVIPPIRNGARRIASAQSSAMEFFKTIDMITGPIDPRTKEAFYGNMVDDGFFDINAEPGSGRMSYNLISSLDTGVNLMDRFHDLFVELGYEIGYYEDDIELEAADNAIKQRFDQINDMKTLFYTYLEELKNFQGKEPREKQALRKNFVWLVNNWYQGVRRSRFADRYDAELDEYLDLISNLGSESAVRDAFERVYYSAKSKARRS